MAKKSSVSQMKKEGRALTPEDHNFIRHILARPEEDAPRLGYADWLAERGDRDRAEFIRCQIEAARLAPQDPQREQAATRAATLLQAHEAEWEAFATGFAGFGRVCVFERGLPVWARFGINHFLEDTAPKFARIWQIAPVTKLDLYDLNADAAYQNEEFQESWISAENYAALANMPQLVHVRVLSVCECAIRAEHLRPLLASPHLTNLCELHLSSNRLGDEGMRVVAESPRLAGLTHLDLNTNEVGNQGVEALAQSPHLSNLKTLVLSFNRIGEDGGRALPSAPHLSNLERLDLPGHRLGAAEGDLRQRFGDRLML
jgi:uncharacterized protein (TIGR02996 family)